MRLVLDSSAVITLAGAGALDLLDSWPGGVYSVEAVRQETVDAGLMCAYPDSAAIRECFDRGIIRIHPAQKRDKLSGLSETDSVVIHISQQLGNCVLVANDRTLRRRAGERGIDARYTIEIVEEARLAGRCAKSRRNVLFDAFVANRRYSRAFVDAFLLASGGG